MSRMEGVWTDDDYVSGFLRLDEDAIAAFISNVGPNLRRMLMKSDLSVPLRNDLDDVISMTAVLLIDKIRGYDPSKGALRNWISKLAYNMGVDLIRTRDGRGGTHLDFLGDHDGELLSKPVHLASENDFGELCQSERLEIRALREEVELLPEKQRAIIEADFAATKDKACAKELAATLGTSVDAIYVLRCLARKTLRAGMLHRGFYSNLSA